MTKKSVPGGTSVYQDVTPGCSSRQPNWPFPLEVPLPGVGRATTRTYARAKNGSITAHVASGASR